MRSLRLCLAVGFFFSIVWPPLILAQRRENDFQRVRRLEEVRDLNIRRGQAPERVGYEAAERLTFTAFGRNFELELKPVELYLKDAEIRWVTEQEVFTQKPETRFYKGRLIGQEGWGRFSIDGETVNGLIRTHEDLYFVRPARAMDPTASPRSTLAYRLSDLPSLWESYSCGLDHDIDSDLMEPDPDKPSSALDDYEHLLEDLNVVSSSVTFKETEIHVVADGDYFSTHGAGSADRMAAVINDMAGIYENDVGITFRISASTVYTPETDPFTTSNDPGTLLDSFTFDTSHVSGHDLAHLFTGRDLAGSTIGIAWISVVCNQTYGTGLSQDLSSANSRMLLAAHEVGHNYSARHDNDVQYCQDQPSGYIMWPSLNGNATNFSDCSQNAINNHVGTRSCLSDVVDEPLMEVGSVTANHNWVTVNLLNSYVNPIVIAGPPSFNGSHPGVVRIGNVTSGSFEIRVQEWLYLDNWHTSEQISYIVVEAGRYSLTGGGELEAGVVQTGDCGTDSFANVSFQSSFPSTPLVLTSINTFNGSHPVTTRIRQVSMTAFELTMQEEEANDQYHLQENIAYLAIMPGVGAIQGFNYTTDSFLVDHSFAPVPDSPFELMLEEERSVDTEIYHLDETVGFLLLDNDVESFLLAHPQTTRGQDPVALRMRE